MKNAPHLNPLERQDRARQRGAVTMTLVGFVTLVAFVIWFGLNLRPVPDGSATVSTATLEQLSLKGFNVSQGWRFLPEDDPSWTAATLPRDGWQPVDMEAFEGEDWDGIGWFALPIDVDRDVNSRDLALLATQYGGLELYLNDQQLYSAGMDGSGLATRFNDPIPLPGTLRTGDELKVRVHADQLRRQMDILWQPMNQTQHPAGFTLAIGSYSDAEALIAAKHRNNSLLLLAGFTLLVLGFYHAYFHVMSGSMPAVRQYAVFAILAGLHSLLWYGTNASTPVSWLIPVYLARFALLFAGSFIGLHIIMELYDIRRANVLWGGFAATLALLVAGLLTGIEGHGAAMLLFGVLTTVTLVWARIQHTSYIGFIMFGFHGHIVAPLYWLATYRFWVPGPITMEAFWFLGGGVTYLILAYILTSRHAALEREREQTYVEMISLTDQAQELETLVQRRGEEHQQLATFNEQLRDQLQRQTRERLQAERQAAFGQVVQGIVHNLKGPLATVSGSVDILTMQRQQLDSQIEQLNGKGEPLRNTVSAMERPLNGLRAGSDRLDDMIHSLLDKSRADRVQARTRFDLNDMVQAEMEFIRADKQLRHRIQVDLDLHDGPLVVEAVRGEIAQVFENLVGNARDALHGQENPRIVIRTTLRDGQPCFQIEDNGPGVPGEIADKIFDPFFTTKPSAEETNGNDTPKGTGLGLWMCQQTMDDNKGGLELFDAPGGGALFCVTLPPAEHQVAA